MAFDRSVYETYTVDGAGLTLDQIIWRRYRRQTPGLVEAVLDMNYGLADQGPLLARGSTLKIPVDNPATPTTRPLVRLW
jgi:phage tail protein X